MADRKNVYTIYDDGQNGTVEISEHVLSTIAGLAAMEVEGIASMKGDISASQITRSAMNNLSKCVRITMNDDGTLKVQMVLNIRYGHSLPETTKKVQERVKDTLESMTGLKVSNVNISISDVKIEKTARVRRPKKSADEEE